MPTNKIKNSDDKFTRLDFLRELIDNIDEAILSILYHRGQVVNFIVEYKAAHKITREQSNIRKQRINELMAFSESLQIDRNFVNIILKHLFETSHTFVHTSSNLKRHNFFLQEDDMLPGLNHTLMNLDKSFLSLLSERMKLVEQIGKYKTVNKIPPLAISRWEAVLQSKINIAYNLNINTKAIKDLYSLIHQESLRIEEVIAKLQTN
ncbi:MAG: chorismate mutase [Burkholderiales bacterium]|nr:chorismate mutase [Burkholderiales bacterium]